MHRNPSVSAHDFAMTPKTNIPRSKFRADKTLKTTFDGGYLNPILVEEVLPGDDWTLDMTSFVRMATPLYPIMDNLHLDIFFFNVPNRLVWDNWIFFMGEQRSPGDSISFNIPKKTSPAGGFAINSIYDLMGLPCAGQITGADTTTINCLPLRAYNLIYNEWFRDENLINWVTTSLADGPDTTSTFALQRRGKRPDYFTTCLPWPQKSTNTIYGALTGNAVVKTDANVNSDIAVYSTVQPGYVKMGAATTYVQRTGTNDSTAPLYTDLTTATGIAINTFRQAIMIQEFLERDARGGTRYTELVRRHFGVVSPDARLQRPEYLGGGHVEINVAPIAQAGQTGLTGGTTPLGTLGAMAQATGRNIGFRRAFTEHGYIIGLACVRADLTYQQGTRKHWSRDTRYDYYDPSFANLGEQAVLQKEIYTLGQAGPDATVFGYQGRWDEYRYFPSEIVGLFNSKHAGTLDPWHLAQNFTSAPTLNKTFIEETPPVQRVLAVTAQDAKQFLGDFFFRFTLARQMPMYNVPGISGLKL